MLEANEIESNGDPIKMKVISDGKKFSFYYAVGEGEWNLLTDNIDAYYLSTAQSYGFTGTNIGLYATSKPY